MSIAKRAAKALVLACYHVLARLLPVSRRTVVFMSSLGRSYTGNPRAVCEKMAELGMVGEFRCYYILDEPERFRDQLPKGVCPLRNARLRYYLVMARAGAWVSDTRFQNYMVKRKKTVYIQTWHGTPLKKLGLDLTALHMAGGETLSQYKEAFRKNAATWDYLISQNPFSTEVFRRAFGFRGTMLAIGYPRNDQLVESVKTEPPKDFAENVKTEPPRNFAESVKEEPAGDFAEGVKTEPAGDFAESVKTEPAGNFTADTHKGGFAGEACAAGTGSSMRTALREKLRIPPGKKVMLYAPTWRDDAFYNEKDYRFATKLDFGKMSQAFAKDYVLVVKYHYMVRERSGEQKYPAFVRTVGEDVDIAQLYLLSDLLITDYSSAMFDYSLLKRPMYFFAYDLENYRDTLRGFYFDFEAEAPGPIVVTTEALIAAIGEGMTESTMQRYRRFAEKYNPYDDGHASEKVLEIIKRHKEGKDRT